MNIEGEIQSLIEDLIRKERQKIADRIMSARINSNGWREALELLENALMEDEE